jgi:hypothetical protein
MFREALDALATQVSAGNIGTAPEWGGAEVMVTKGDPELRMDEFSRFSEPLVVHSTHAREVSWLFEQVRDAFRAAKAAAGGDSVESSDASGSGAGSSVAARAGSGAWLGGGGSGKGAAGFTNAAREAAETGTTEQEMFAMMGEQVNRVIDANRANGGEACKKTQCMAALQYAYLVAARIGE